MTFLQRLLYLLLPRYYMSQTRQDLNDAIDAAQVDATNLVAAAGQTQAAVQSAADRVAATPPVEGKDFQAEVDKIAAVRTTIAQASSTVAATQAVADNILPAP